MADVKPFRGLRPLPVHAEQVAAPPYDVLNSDEARERARGNPYSFLHVNKPEIDLDPSVDIYDAAVYRKGAENLGKLMADGIMRQDAQPCFYVYKQIMGTHEQVGLVAGASVAEYEQDLIKKHEFTRPDKEDDRVRHIDTLNAQVGPVFLTYPAREDIDRLMARAMTGTPEFDFSSDGVRHTVWVVSDRQHVEEIRAAFRTVAALYVADGHHRSAAATRVKQMRQQANAQHSGKEAYNYFLTVIFPHDQMQILDYNRVVQDLNGATPQAFLEKVSARFEVVEAPTAAAAKPTKAHQFAMYIDGKWYRLTARDGSYDAGDPVRRLDVSILQENLLAPLLGIENPRTDKRIDFIGGIRGLQALEKRVDSGSWQVAFALYPTSIVDLMAIADAGKVMPPKSTWFEPKLRSGLIVHLLSDDA